MSTNKWKFLLLFASFAFQICIAQPDAVESEAIAKFVRILSKDLERDNMHGSISVLVMKDDKRIFTQALGYQHADKELAADSLTIYSVASITKTVTATALLQLVATGKIRLEDSVEKYVPEVKFLKGYSSSDVMTIQQLASHTSGLPRDGECRPCMSGPVEQWREKLLASLPQTRIQNPAGKKYEYSNIGFAVLGLALEKASGIPFTELIQQMIFQPLQMNNSFFTLDPSKKDHWADGLLSPSDIKMENSPTKPTLQNIGHTGWGYGVPAGGLYTTPDDLGKFISALFVNKTLLNAAQLELMQTIQPRSEKYGLGLMVADNGNRVVGHSGSMFGAASNFRIDLNSGYSVIVLRNYKIGKTNLEYESWKFLSALPTRAKKS